MRPHKTLVIQPAWNPGLVFNPAMYPGAEIYKSCYPANRVDNDPVLDNFLVGLDIVFTCETPYNFWLYVRARERGVKTVLQYNYEFLDNLADSSLPAPDLFAAPSLWRWEDVPFRNKVFLPVPVSRDVLPFQKREQLRTILHIAGIPAIHDRNGTGLLLEAMRLLPSGVDVCLRLRTQARFDNPCPARIEMIHASVDEYWKLYNQEDVFIMPRKFGGLCLAMAEAASCGMPVIAPAIDPQIRYLPGRALLPARKSKSFVARTSVDVYETTPQLIARKIVELYKEPGLVAALSAQSDRYADSISWERLKPLYENTFARLLNGDLPLA